jgi:hypothetical protein
MSKRLPELLRQRALLQEHLAWLEREIAHEQGVPVAKPVVLAPLQTSSAATPPALPAAVIADKTGAPPPANELDATAEKIIGQYQQDLGALSQDTRKGCLVFFGIALGVTLLVATIAYALYARHLGRWW